MKRCLPVLLMLLCWSQFDFDAKSGHADETGFEILVEILKSQEEIANAQAQAARMSLIQRAIELSRMEKDTARSEQKDVERDQAKKQFDVAVKNWALGEFEAQRPQRLPQTANLSRYLQRLQNAREQARHLFVHDAQAARGAIRSGRALNFFLDACGSVAANHEFFREQLRKDLADPNLPPETRTELEARQRILNDIGNRPVLTEQHRRNIPKKFGTSGKAVVSGDEGTLSLYWPTLFSLPEYKPHCDSLKQAKEAALEDLRNGQSIQPETQRQMLNACDEMKRLFERYRMRYIGDKESQSQGGTSEYLQAKNFLMAKRMEIGEFLMARTLSDVMPDESFQGTSIESLLSFMTRQGYTFGKTETAAQERASTAIYQGMLDYYGDLYSLHLAVQSDQRQEQMLGEHAEKLFQEGYRSTMDDVKAALEARPPLHWTEKLKNLGEAIHYAGQGYKAIRDTP